MISNCLDLKARIFVFLYREIITNQYIWNILYITTYWKFMLVHI